MLARKEIGRERYGTVLQPFNGRDALRDAYEEALDLCQYLKQALVERETSLRSNDGARETSTESNAVTAALKPETTSDSDAPIVVG